MKEFKLPPDILSEIAFHVVGNMEPRLHMIIRDVIDSVTLEAREELQKMVAAQAGAHYDSADKLKALQETVARLEQLVARTYESCPPPVEVTRVTKMIGLTAEEEALIMKLRGDK